MKTISYKGGSWEAEVLKSASLSSGYRIYLFKRYLKGIKPSLTGEFVVAVKSPDDTTAHWDCTNTLRSAVESYTGYLCCYA